jgi:hypothetical protein
VVIGRSPSPLKAPEKLRAETVRCAAKLRKKKSSAAQSTERASPFFTSTGTSASVALGTHVRLRL